MDYKFRTPALVVAGVLFIVAIGLLLGRGSITGASISDTIACEDNDDCDDKIEGTEDICKNPGTEYSLCVNRPIR